MPISWFSFAIPAWLAAYWASTAAVAGVVSVSIMPEYEGARATGVMFGGQMPGVSATTCIAGQPIESYCAAAGYLAASYADRPLGNSLAAKTDAMRSPHLIYLVAAGVFAVSSFTV